MCNGIVKVLGIFCRLWYRDGKVAYLGDLPLTFEYVRDACRRYPELVEFERWLALRVAPLLDAANAREGAARDATCRRNQAPRGKEAQGKNSSQAQDQTRQARTQEDAAGRAARSKEARGEEKARGEKHRAKRPR